MVLDFQTFLNDKFDGTTTTTLETILYSIVRQEINVLVCYLMPDRQIGIGYDIFCSNFSLHINLEL
jgi:hypothetical protein